MDMISLNKVKGRKMCNDDFLLRLVVIFVISQDAECFRVS